MTTKVILTIKFEALIELEDEGNRLTPREMMDYQIMKRLMHPRQLRRITDLVDAHVCLLARTSSEDISINNPSIQWQYFCPQEES